MTSRVRVAWLGLALAAGACLCAALAVVPLRFEARGLLLEQAGTPSPGRPLLLRLAVQDAELPQWWAPASARVQLRGPSGAQAAATVSAAPEAAWVHVALTPTGPGPYRVNVAAEGFEASFSPREVAAEAAFTLPPPEHGLEVLLEGRALVSEVPAVVLLRQEGGTPGTLFEVRSEDPAFEVQPASVVLDACGAAEARVVAHTMDALLLVGPRGAPPSRRRLSVEGAVGLRLDGERAQVEAALGGLWLYWAAGDGAGPLAWGMAHLREARQQNVSLSLERPAGATWLAVGPGHLLESAGAVAWPSPGDAGCTETALGRRVAAARRGAPARLRTQRVFEGVREALARRGARQQRVQRYAAVGGALQLGAMMAVLLWGAVRRNPAGLGDLGYSTWQRASRVLAVVSLLAVLAWVLVAAVSLRA